jgi:hypothetical protein
MSLMTMVILSSRAKPYLQVCLISVIGFFLNTNSWFYNSGRFFGEVHGEIMEQLTNHDIYKRVRVVDYQAICFHLYSKSFGFILQNVSKHWILFRKSFNEAFIF